MIITIYVLVRTRSFKVCDRYILSHLSTFKDNRYEGFIPKKIGQLIKYFLMINCHFFDVYSTFKQFHYFIKATIRNIESD